jgi:hypothetical protein
LTCSYSSPVSIPNHSNSYFRFRTQFQTAQPKNQFECKCIDFILFCHNMHTKENPSMMHDLFECSLFNYLFVEVRCSHEMIHIDDTHVYKGIQFLLLDFLTKWVLHGLGRNCILARPRPRPQEKSPPRPTLGSDRPLHGGYIITLPLASSGYGGTRPASHLARPGNK